MEERSFTVLYIWYSWKSINRCIISPSILSNELTLKDNHRGISFNNYSNLKEAILASDYNPSYIEFWGLTEDEINLKDEFLKTIKWDSWEGIVPEDEF